MAVVIGGRCYWLWRAVDNEGEVLDFLIQSKRDAKAAAKLMRRLLKRQGFAPSRIVTDKLRSYRTAFRCLGLAAWHDQGLRANNRAQNPFEGGSARCSVSDHPGLRSAFCPSAPRSTILSTTNVIFQIARSSSSCDPTHSTCGHVHPLLPDGQPSTIAVSSTRVKVTAPPGDLGNAQAQRLPIAETVQGHPAADIVHT